MKLLTTQSFGEDILQLQLGWHMAQDDLTFLQFVTKEMKVNLDMFHSLMKHVVCSDLESYMIVTVQHHWLSMNNSKNSKERLQIYRFTSRHGHG